MIRRATASIALLGLGWAGVSAGESWSYDDLDHVLERYVSDRGLVDYDAPVAEYWPEFAKAGKGKITVRHVLSHQSGLYHIRQMIDHVDRMLDWEHMIEARNNLCWAAAS